MKSAIKRKKGAGYAPIAIFAYNRPRHLRTCWQSLAKNPEAKQTDLIVFSDGWKTGLDKPSVEEVRVEIGRIKGFRSVQPVLRKENLGLARSIVKGVTASCKKYGQIIVVEDDLEVSPFFLKFMNEGLKIYRQEPRVASIHGYIYPVTGRLPETFFLKGADCWGWATWQRAWQTFERNAAKLLEDLKNKNLMRQFDLEGSYPYSRLLADCIRKGDAGSWAVRWHASCFLQGKLTLYPGRSLVVNQGLDRSGTHCTSSRGLRSLVSHTPVNLKKTPCKENYQARQSFSESLRRQQKKNFLKKIIGRIKPFFRLWQAY